MGLRHMVMKISSKRKDVPPTLVPGYRQALSDVTEEMMSGAVGDLFYLQLELFRSLQPDVLELNLRPFVVDLQSDGPPFQAFWLDVVDELRCDFAINEELALAATGDYMDFVPLTFPEICRRQSSGDSTVMRLAVCVDNKPHSAIARVFLACCKMKVPCAEYLRAYAHVAEVGVITFEWTLARKVKTTANFDAGVAFARQAITQLKFKVSKMLILPNEIGQSVGAPVPDNRSIANGPV